MPRALMCGFSAWQWPRIKSDLPEVPLTELALSPKPNPQEMVFLCRCRQTDSAGRQPVVQWVTADASLIRHLRPLISFLNDLAKKNMHRQAEGKRVYTIIPGLLLNEFNVLCHFRDLRQVRFVRSADILYGGHQGQITLKGHASRGKWS